MGGFFSRVTNCHVFQQRRSGVDNGTDTPLPGRRIIGSWCAGIFGGESSLPSVRTVQPTSQRSTVQTELFGGHAGWGTDDVQKTRLDPSAMVAAGTKKSEEASRAAPLTERPDPNKSSVTGGIFGPGANPGTITSQTKVDRNRSSIQGGIFG